jgi:hypothetical protein
VKRIISIDPSIGKNVNLEKLNKESDEEIIKPEYEEEIEIESDTEIEIKKVDYKSVDLNEMPELRGVSLKDAISIMRRLGLDFTCSGSGRVVEQSIKPGKEIKKGMKIQVKLQEKAFSGANIY